MQMAAVQTPLVQSRGRRQPCPFAHAPQRPPQSTAVSSPFFSPSLHVAQIPPTHTPPPAQSSAEPQALPDAHLVQ
jgi:hypothetical protein